MSENIDIKEGVTVYEVGYLLLPSIPEESLSGVVDSMKSIVTKEGGNVLGGEDPFKYDLAYTMSKTIGASRYVVNDAYIGWLKFELEAGNAPKVKAEIEKMNEVLRLLLIKTPHETGFTFAKARQALLDKEEAEAEAEKAPVEEVVVE